MPLSGRGFAHSASSSSTTPLSHSFPAHLTSPSPPILSPSSVLNFSCLPFFLLFLFPPHYPYTYFDIFESSPDVCIPSNFSANFLLLSEKQEHYFLDLVQGCNFQLVPVLVQRSSGGQGTTCATSRLTAPIARQKRKNCSDHSFTVICYSF